MILRILLLLYFVSPLLSFQDEIVSEIANSDSVDYKINFFKGDTLYYKVFTWDSLITNYENPHLMQREELIMVTCDSVNKKGVMYLTQQLIDYKSKEINPLGEKITNNAHEWLFRKSIIGIDSLGKRITAFYADSSKQSTSPGGAYMPPLFFEIGASKKKINESWLVTNENFLVENIFPPSIFKSTSLLRADENIDTLGYNCNQIMYIKTGKGSFHFESEKDYISNTSIINSSGLLRISKEFHIPIHMFVTMEQKITIYKDEELTIPSFRYIYSDYVLDKFIEGNARLKAKN